MFKKTLSAIAMITFCGCVANVLGGDEKSACDFRMATMEPEDRCQDRGESSAAAGTAISSFNNECMRVGGKVLSACPRSESVGGCQFATTSGGSSVTNWYYPPEDEASVKTRCMGEDNASFIAP